MSFSASPFSPSNSTSQEAETMKLVRVDDEEIFPPLSTKDLIVIKAEFSSLMHTELGPNCCDVSDHIVLATDFFQLEKIPSRIQELNLLSELEWSECVRKIREALPKSDDIPPSRWAILKWTILCCCGPCVFFYQGQRNGEIGEAYDTLCDAVTSISEQYKSRGMIWAYRFNPPPPGRLQLGTAWIEINLNLPQQSSRR